MSQPYRRTRDDHSLELASDYVELIRDLIQERGEARGADLAARLGVSHVTVSKTLARLSRDGYIRYEKYRSIFLTESGEALAVESRRRHDLVEGLLIKIGVSPDAAKVDAEGMEHHASPDTLLAIESFLNAR